MQIDSAPSLLSRRRFIGSVAGALTLALTAQALPVNRRPRILLRSAWQTVNIGDIAHTPGFLTLMERHLPGVDTTLWPVDIGNGVREILLQRFPTLKIVESEADLATAFEECDFLVHSSSASLGNHAQIEQWMQSTGKGFGVYGITFDDHQSWRLEPDSPQELQRKIEIANQAEFIFFRDSESLNLARKLGCKAKTMGFAPDSAFGCDLMDDARAEAYLGANGLEHGRFLCCIPRLRFSPYWLMKPGVARDERLHAVNEKMKEQDHAPLREAVRRLVNETDYKVLLCPEDVSQIAVNREMIYDRLSPAEQKRVVWKADYWLTGEAVSTYVRSAGLFGNEMHSPILCIAQGVPAMVCRWEGQSSKGLMWKDIGLDEWLFNFDLVQDRERFPDQVLRMATDRSRSLRMADDARKVVHHHQAKTMAHLGKCIDAT
jgi:hypothetical protein